MAKDNGQKARPGASIGMEIDGDLRFVTSAEKIRDLAEGKTVRFIWPGKGGLNLQIEAGPADKILQSRVWFTAEDVVVSIDNNIHEDNRNGGDSSIFLPDYLAVTLRESEKSDIGINVTPDQAKALAAVLMRYAQAWEAAEALRDERPARA